MKVTREHYTKMLVACTAVLKAHPGVKDQYRNAGLSDTRLAWDVLRASNIDGVYGTRWICDNIYSYANDDHITTALLRILRAN